MKLIYRTPKIIVFNTTNQDVITASVEYGEAAPDASWWSGSDMGA